ncbi:cadherin domain-containing protein [Rhodobacter sp. JA431]|uniref:cadherin repeat domain-containing protein n=1 Tax=Rhodobacter sp. JA431 TaxID=570013 RepID=UPI000BC8ADA0|nr:cadherin repeat domain-containing protein [Rhodobacter sp. JA431]SOC00517.1 cadherin domain-containing protein [Rhodobacter sp. JA431]
MKDTVTFDRITVAADQSALFSSIEPIVAAKTDGSALRARPTPFKAQRRLAQGGMATVSVLALAACQGGGSGGSGSSANGTSGVVVKGPVEGAFVFSDNNDNGVFDEGEAYGITGSDGSFLLADGDIDPDAPIIANLEGAVDTTSGRVYGEGETFTAPAGSTVISAYTTMMQEEGWSADALGTLLGLEAGEFDPTTFNPYADGTDPTLALVAEGRAQQIMAIVDTLTAVLEAAGLEGETAYDLVQEVVAGRLDDDFGSIGAMIDQVIDDLLAKEVVQEAEGGVTHQVLSGLQADLINALEEVLMQIAAVTDLGDGEMVPAYQLVVELIEQAKAAALAEANQSGSGNIPLGDDGVAAAMVQDIATNAAPEMTDWSGQVTVSEDTSTLVVLTAAATDADGDTITYGLTGPDADKFFIDEASGEVTFLDQPDFEEKASFRFTVTADDGLESTARQVTVTITDANDAPRFGKFDSSPEIAENTVDAEVVTVTARDQDGDTLNYALTSGGDADAFTIDAATGVLRFNGSPDYETQKTYKIQVEVTDGTATETQEITVSVTDANDAPVMEQWQSNLTVDENIADLALVTAQASDEDGDTLSYALSGADDTAFTIDAATGAISFKDTPNYEEQASYSFTVTASDGNGGTIDQAVSVSITDINEAPVFGAWESALSVAENTTNLLLVNATATDEDTGTTLAYALTSGGDADAFTINAETGAISFKTSPNYEAKDSYSMTVAVYDGQNTVTRDITVDITDINEAPTLTLSATSATLSENLGDNSIVFNAQASDEDAGDTVTLSLEGADAKYFHIDQDTGDIEFSGKAPYPDYEAKSDYSFTVVATDDAGLSDSQDVTVSLTNVDPLVHLTVDTALFATAGASYEAALSTVEAATAEFFADHPAWGMVLDDVFSTSLAYLSPTVSSNGITVTSDFSGNSVAFNFANFSPDSVESLVTTIQNFSASGDFNDLTISGGFVSMEIKDSNGDLLASLSNTANGMEFSIEGVTTGQMDTLVLNGSFGNQIVDYIALWETVETVALDPSATDLDGALTLLSGLNDLIDMTGISMMAQDTTLATVSLDSTDTAQSLTYTLGDHIFTIAVDGLPGLIEGMIDAAGGAEAFIDAAMAGFYVESGEWNPGQQQIGGTTVNYTETYEELSIFYHFTSTYYEYGDGPSSGYYWIDEESNILGWSETWEGGIDPELSGEPSYIDGWGFDGFGNWLTEAEYVALHDILSNIQDYLGDLDDGINALALSIDYSIAGDSVLSLDVDKIADFFAAVQDSQVGPGDAGQLIAEYTADDGTTPVTELSNPGEDWAITLVGLEADDLSSFAGGFLDSQVLATS